MSVYGIGSSLGLGSGSVSVCKDGGLGLTDILAPSLPCVGKFVREKVRARDRERVKGRSG